MNRIFFLALPLLVGCAATPSTHYRIEIDPAFTLDEQEQVVGAVQAWQDAVPVTFDTEIAPCWGAEDDRICIHPTHGPDTNGIVGHTSRASWAEGESASIELWVDVEEALGHPLELDAAHELGHAMALQHTGPGTVMCAAVECMTAAPTPTDVDQWLAVRGMR